MQINPGGDVPEEYYLYKLMEARKNEMERVEIGRACSHRVSKHVETPQTKLMYLFTYILSLTCKLMYILFHIPSRWEFMSTDYDIWYRLYHKTEDGKKKDVVSK